MDGEPLRPWERTGHEVVGRFRIFDLLRETYRHPEDGRTHDYLVIDSADWVNVVPITPEGRVVLVRQFRPGTREVTIEVPGGMVEPGEVDPAVAAVRELEEETGYVAGRVEKTRSIRPNPAFIRNWHHMFVARDAIPAGRMRPDEGEYLRPFEATWDEVDRMVGDGSITHALCLTALMFARYFRG